MLIVVVRETGGSRMSTRSNPFAELERLIEQMSRQFSEDFRTWKPIGQFEDNGAESTAMDLVEHDDRFVVTFDLPGFETEDVEVRVTDHTLRIEADHDEEESEDGESYIRRERHHRSIRQSVRLPEEVDTEAATAKMKHGVLTVTLPRLAIEEEHAVEISGE